MASAPTDFGDYRLGRRIAVGGMAEIFRAERRSDGAQVALKLLLPQYARDPELVRMLADEARVQSSLVHPNLVRVLELGRVGKQPYIALELVEGASLREILRDGPLPVALALHVVAEILRALVVVHEAQVVHRDVTPENILCSRRGDVRLGDFGIARSALAGGRTRTGVIKGKLAYLSPEQVKNQPLDGRSDLFAVGLVLFEAIAGEPLLRGDTEPDLLRAAEAPVQRPTGELRVDELLRTTLAIVREDRPADARALLAQVTELGPDATGLSERVARAAAAAHDDDEARPGTVRVAPRTRRRPRLLLAAAGLATAAAVAGAVVWLRPAETARAVDASVAADASTLDASPDAAADAPPDAPLDAAEVAPLDAPRRAVTTRPVTDAGASDAAADLRASVAPRLTRLRAELAQRGLVDDDLPAAARDALARAADARTGEAAELALGEAQRAVDAIRIDEAFVKRKLDRVNAAVRRADRTKLDVAAIDRLVAQALDDLLDRRYDACNRRLNEIARILGQGTQ